MDLRPGDSLQTSTGRISTVSLDTRIDTRNSKRLAYAEDIRQIIIGSLDMVFVFASH